MSREKRNPERTAAPAGAADTEGWESLAEDSGGSLTLNPELEEALREAAEAVDAAERATSPGAADPAASPDPPASPRTAASPEAAHPAEREVEDLSARLVETEDRLLRLQADFENFRRRALREREEGLRYGHQNLVKDLLSAVDNLDRAIDHVRGGEGGDFEGLLRGVELVRKELLGTLAKFEVAEIEAKGRTFDPTLHEAMAQTPDESVPPGTVIEVLQKGYQLRDRLLRPARVVVAGKGPEPEPEAGKGEASD